MEGVCGLRQISHSSQRYIVKPAGMDEVGMRDEVKCPTDRFIGFRYQKLESAVKLYVENGVLPYYQCWVETDYTHVI